MSFHIDRENRGLFFSLRRVSIMFFWHTDMFEILPLVRLCYGYIRGIFYGEVVLQVMWMIFSFQITFYAKK